MKCFLLGLGFIIALSMVSCKSSETAIIAKTPYFTEISKLEKLKAGMSLSQVNELLGVEPYDIYISNDGNKIISYQYRLKFRKLKAKQNKQGFNSLESQTGGAEYFDEPHTVFIYFTNKGFASFITDEGVTKSSLILAENNLLKIIDSKELVDFPSRADLYKKGDIWQIDNNLKLKKVEEEKETGIFQNKEKPQKNTEKPHKTSAKSESQPNPRVAIERSFGVNLLGNYYGGDEAYKDDAKKFGLGYSSFRFWGGKKLGLYQDFAISFTNVNQDIYDYYGYYTDTYEYSSLNLGYFIAPAYKLLQSKNKKLNLNVFAGPGFYIASENEEPKIGIAVGANLSYYLNDRFGFYAKGGYSNMSTVQAGIAWRINK